MAGLRRHGLTVLVLADLLQVRADWITTTTADMASAEKLHVHLKERFGHKIENIHAVDIRSYYWWEGEIQDTPEIRTTIDSEVPFSDLRAAVEAIHPYEVPMIISAANSGTLIGNKGQPDLYLMATADVNETTFEEAASLAKEFVQVRFVACAQVEAVKELKDTHRLTFKTIRAKREVINREFGGLSFHWTNLKGNQPYLDWVAKAVEASHGEL